MKSIQNIFDLTVFLFFQTSLTFFCEVFDIVHPGMAVTHLICQLSSYYMIKLIFFTNSLLHFCYVLLTVHLSKILGNDQLDTQLLYFTIRLL